MRVISRIANSIPWNSKCSNCINWNTFRTTGSTRSLVSHISDHRTDYKGNKDQPNSTGVSTNNPLSPAAFFESHQKDINLDDLHAEWWDTNGELRALHSMNQIRVPLIRDGLISAGTVSDSNRYTPNVLSGVDILEVGCGGGILTEALARLNANVTGIDIGYKLINAARNHADEDKKIASRINYAAESIDKHLLHNRGKYDAVIASEVLEHVDHKTQFLKDCVEALKPGGSIFITTLNKTPLSWFGGVFVAENILNLLPKNTHSWEKFISPDDVERMLQDLDCSTVLLNGMKYEFWWNRWSWSRFTEINYALHAVKKM